MGRLVFVPAPDADAREAVFHLHLESRDLVSEDLNYSELAARTENYSADAIRQIVEAAAEVEEQGVGVDPGLAAEIELDPVAGSEVDELGKTGEARQVDEVLPRKLGRQRCRRELIHVDCTVGRSDDADAIQARSSRQGFYATTLLDSVTRP